MNIKDVTPLYSRVLLKEIVESEQKTEGGIILPQKSEDEKDFIIVKHKVVAVAEEIDKYKVGDIVLASRRLGTELDVLGVRYRCMDGKDVFAKVSE